MLSISSAFLLVVCWWAPIRPQPPTWRIWTGFPLSFFWFPRPLFVYQARQPSTWCSWRETRRSTAYAAKPARWACTTSVRTASGSSAAWENWWDAWHTGHDTDSRMCTFSCLGDSGVQSSASLWQQIKQTHENVKTGSLTVSQQNVLIQKSHSMCQHASASVTNSHPHHPLHHRYIITSSVLDNNSGLKNTERLSYTVWFPWC